MSIPQDLDSRRNVRLLVIDDDSHLLEVIRAALDQDGLEIQTEDDPERGLAVALNDGPDIVLSDLVMPGLGGMDLLTKIVEVHPQTDVVLMTAHYSTESAVEAIQKGASDYLEKPIPIGKLRQRIGKLIAGARKYLRLQELEQELLKTAEFEGIVGRSGPMLELFAQVRRIAPHFRTTLITGATGTGKELVARALHNLSLGNAGPFAVCNCSAVVESLFESELFGHVKGAFTGAIQDRLGLFEYANGGTVFLDEIGDMPLATQSKILRIVQNQEIQRVGSPVTRKVDVRIIAATHRDLQAMVMEKSFREDLYFRLSAVELCVPPLAERMEDLNLLVQFFVSRLASEYKKPIRGLTPRAASLLARYSWPGNVRELENAMAHACMMAEGEFIDIRDLPNLTQKNVPADPLQGTAGDLLSLDAVIRSHVVKVLSRMGGNRKRAAEILGIGRTTLYRMLKQSEPEDKHTRQPRADGK